MAEADTRIEKIEVIMVWRVHRVHACGILKTHSKGSRTNYIHGFTEESTSLYEAHQKQYSRKPFDEETIDTGDRLTDMMTKERKEKWEEFIT